MGYYEYKHTVETGETTLVGNVHFVAYLRWQGRCKENFLKEQAPALVADGLRLHTVKAECEYFSEILAADELSVRMRLEELTRTQLQFTFDYVRFRAGSEKLAARGRQRVACVVGAEPKVSEVPGGLRDALLPYAESPC
ncbi:4-hydroxybenzoyl-CoA thioesterase family active site [Alloactinosynnema sp. L-07]|uniref:acyl-CoA thioesterase n=1 Tax=Alloactinosynnema sp. L-07 TaxID=1653480 RepID=UPI00065EF076|nr:acyl-CoA thioesterase [Alloactinosynnema sp. L-07]CRK62024.1 4-hydroxybenzoyl-CoA thioesterase family active site [Alloactinosynnema sp. L-07]